jgi:hypothetical protein
MAQSQTAGTAEMVITLACATGSIFILGYAAVVLNYLRRLPEPQEGGLDRSTDITSIALPRVYWPTSRL